MKKLLFFIFLLSSAASAQSGEEFYDQLKDFRSRVRSGVTLESVYPSLSSKIVKDLNTWSEVERSELLTSLKLSQPQTDGRQVVREVRVHGKLALLYLDPVGKNDVGPGEIVSFVRVEGQWELDLTSRFERERTLLGFSLALQEMDLKVVEHSTLAPLYSIFSDNSVEELKNLSERDKLVALETMQDLAQLYRDNPLQPIRWEIGKNKAWVILDPVLNDTHEGMSYSRRAHFEKDGEAWKIDLQPRFFQQMSSKTGMW